MEHQWFENTKTAELLRMNHHRTPRKCCCTILGAVHPVTDCQYCSNSSGSCFSVNHSTRAFTYYSI